MAYDNNSIYFVIRATPDILKTHNLPLVEICNQDDDHCLVVHLISQTKETEDITKVFRIPNIQDIKGLDIADHLFYIHGDDSKLLLNMSFSSTLILKRGNVVYFKGSDNSFTLAKVSRESNGEYRIHVKANISSPRRAVIHRVKRSRLFLSLQHLNEQHLCEISSNSKGKRYPNQMVELSFLAKDKQLSMDSLTIDLNEEAISMGTIRVFYVKGEVSVTNLSNYLRGMLCEFAIIIVVYVDREVSVAEEHLRKCINLLKYRLTSERIVQKCFKIIQEAMTVFILSNGNDSIRKEANTLGFCFQPSCLEILISWRSESSQKSKYSEDDLFLVQAGLCISWDRTCCKALYSSSRTDDIEVENIFFKCV